MKTKPRKSLHDRSDGWAERTIPDAYVIPAGRVVSDVLRAYASVGWANGYRAAQRESAAVRDLVRHCWVHSGYPDCGYRQMTTPQKKLYCQLVGRTYEP